jgi:hypothetical protein
MVGVLFEERAFQGVTEEEAVSILEDFMISPDRWLSLIANFLVSELGLQSRWPKLVSRNPSRSFESLDV